MPDNRTELVINIENDRALEAAIREHLEPLKAHLAGLSAGLMQFVAGRVAELEALVPHLEAAGKTQAVASDFFRTAQQAGAVAWTPDPAGAFPYSVTLKFADHAASVAFMQAAALVVMHAARAAAA